VLWGIFLVASTVLLWRARMPWLLLIAFVVLHVGVFVGGPIVWNHLEPYQKARLTSFVEPEKDPAGSGYQLLQSKIAVGSGGMWGKGYLQGTQKALAFLPQQHTDFIFGVLGEEFGFLGAFVTVGLFAVLVLRAVYVAVHCRNAFASLVAVGIASLLLYHTVVNMAMSLGLMPVTGLPLPLVSYGGSFLVSVCGMIGLLLNISAHRFDY
jgi:rod shape determining protein RodA